MGIRDEIVDAVLREVIGPSPSPNYLDEATGEEIVFMGLLNQDMVLGCYTLSRL